MEYDTPNPPLSANHPLVGTQCFFCHRQFEAGDVTKFASLGPANKIELKKARRGLPFIEGPPIELHYLCGNRKLAPAT